ncbi:hypothetical protein HMPREF1986_00599 [Oribacterium sp. oral taxon 078 str. F0263]|uniref:MmcQ/YjbR family DNA-binding protein n=1 Tax=Oribacterium sp. oral taxon 078 TaxID=652706 RepID=UPI0003ADC9C5|nr:MmcQ/YjbR family DNA-binding protein [Oribacterium sp. oral taxon 078]ERL22335.1 hypothetical protein HMPREF1986_00599 [Oribacterium sp. oral taxon 078 str. F0263]
MDPITGDSLREQVFRYVREKYKSEIEYLWARYPDYAVFRHEDNRKWYGIIMSIPRDRLGLSGDGLIDILDVKLDDPLLKDILLQQPGYYPGYHMNKGNWITILLDGTVPFEEICGWIDVCYQVTASKEKKQKLRSPKEWIIPVNPKYYDIEHAFDDTDTIDWKQGAGIRKGDTVYMYVAAPVSTILYKCKVTETDIPYRYEDGKLTIKALMKIRLQKRYPGDRFTFENLKNEYGIYAVRGPRGIPHRLSEALKNR